MIELLAPAGDLEKLKIAILYGADAVFIGGTEFSLRSRASNFTLEDIRQGCEFAHQHHKKVYVTTNILPHEDNLEGLKEYLISLEKCGVDAIILASMAVFETAKKYTNLELHISTQQSILNSSAVNYYASLGATRVVLGRECSLEEIRKIRENTNIELEIFIHGGMCVSYSGRCILSNCMTDRDANRGGCAHSCRWNYDLYKKNQKLTTQDGYFSMGSKDLCAIDFIPSLMDIGVNSLKIEGRMKSLYYIARVVKGYRSMIDDYENQRTLRMDDYKAELQKSENRLTSIGFFKGLPTIQEQLYDMRSEIPNKEFVGIVKEYDEESQIATIEQRNYFMPQDTIEFFGPHLENTYYQIPAIMDKDGNEMDAARHPQQILKIKVPFKLEPYDMLRLVK